MFALRRLRTLLSSCRDGFGSYDMDRSDENDSPFPETVEIEITDSIDLHSFAPNEVGAVVRAYLDEAYGKGFRLVRIIHGKGIGVQREMVRKILADTEFVERFRSGDEFSGGSGATIAELKASQFSSSTSAHGSSWEASE